ncbi:hypothetical protein H8A95_26470 [Bradyrhizobium sp. Pear76]|uniref:hypothetical protein n=1 Tax=Bradyrhizobium oropedii TaxID=1571201 RepID=UPI001E4C883B|nr:hypothetical protein [Bradyrhizobium oropedii]MCC8965767.1 hypothetical protein [Bradyrhizobium oropedii]
MAPLRRILRIIAAFVVGNFLAVIVLLAGKVLVDFDNLRHYAGSDFYGPFLGLLLIALFGTLASAMLALIPTLVVLIFTETLKIRSKWFYVSASGLGAALLDVACTKIDLIQARSFCVAFSVSELAIVTLAGVVAGYAFWRIAGCQSGEWSARVMPAPLALV